MMTMQTIQDLDDVFGGIGYAPGLKVKPSAPSCHFNWNEAAAWATGGAATGGLTGNPLVAAAGGMIGGLSDLWSQQANGACAPKAKR